MIRSILNCLLAPLCFFFLSCSGPKKVTELILPAGLDSHFRSGQVKYSSLKNKIEVLEYRTIRDSFFKSSHKDSILNYGLIVPRSSMVANAYESIMLFGTDSLQCSIHYAWMDFYSTEEQSSLLLDIIFPPDKKAPGYDPYTKTNTPYKRMITGVMKYPSLNGEIQFGFEHGPLRKDFDSTHIGGYLKSGTDSLFIRPLFKELPLHGKNVKPMQILQGYSLMKGNTLYAFLQHAPLVKALFKGGLKDVLFLNSIASAEEQLLMAAYFSLVSRLVFSNPAETLY